MSLVKFYQGKVALVTGGSMGIGRELVRQLLENGCKVVVTGRNEQRLQETLSELENYREQMLIYVGDASDFDSNTELMERIKEHFGELHILINNAGITGSGSLKELKPEVAKSIIDVNIYGSMYPTMAALRHFEGSLQSVLFISSVAGFYGFPGYSSYSISKRALQALAQSLRAELYAENKFVGIAHLGYIENEQDKKALAADGSLQRIPARPKLFLATRKTTARRILKQIKNKTHSDTHNLLGRLILTFTLLFPRITNYFLGRHFAKNLKS